jgi:hypothetical protein
LQIVKRSDAAGFEVLRDEFLQELARRMRPREIGDVDLRREAATAMRAVLGRGRACRREFREAN